MDGPGIKMHSHVSLIFKSDTCIIFNFNLQVDCLSAGRLCNSGVSCKGGIVNEFKILL